MKNKITSILMTAVLAGAVFAGSVSAESVSENAAYTAGTYTASAKGMDGDVTVTVTVGDDGKITDVKADVSGETAGIGAEIGDTVQQQILDAQSAEIDGVAGATVTSTAVKEAAADCLKQASGGAEAVTEAATEAEMLKDGVYQAEFKTDSKMFKVNEAMNGMGTLTVKDGKMTIHISLPTKRVLHLFMGKAADAQKEGARLLNPTKDTVTYSDGTTEEVYGFDIPVQKLDEEFDLALVGTKGKWYDHKVSVSYPTAEQETEMMTEEATE